MSCSASRAVYVQCGSLREGCQGTGHMSINKPSKSQQSQAAVEKGKQQTLMYKQEYILGEA